MGISGLLPALKSIQTPRHIKHWAGKTVAVDAYGWLHRGTVASALELALGKPTTKHVEFSMSRVKMLLHFKVTPYLVFDGDYLPSKAEEESGRATRREASKKAGLELLRQGKTSQAYIELQKAIDVTPQMARQLIDALIEADVKYVVAPYEADAQMYYLERMGIVDAILSEDSDLLVFGCKNLITKLSQFGECIDICRDNFANCKEMPLAGWTDAEFRSMAILSGCDYLENIPRLGLKTAHRLVRKHKAIDRIIKVIRFDGQYSVPVDYSKQFRRAELTFLHQRVYCPIINRIVMCTEPENPLNDEDLIFIGPEIEEEIAQKVARGELDPMTKEPLVKREEGCLNKASTWSRPRKQTSLSQASSTKPSATLHSFFKAKSPLQAQCIPFPQGGEASEVRDSTQIKRRRVSIACDAEENSFKKSRVPGLDIESEQGGPCEAEVSKYFQSPKPKKCKPELLEQEASPQLQPPMVKPIGKENIRPERVPASSGASVSKNQCTVLASIDSTAKGVPGEEDPEILVAQGWRERYALKPQTTTTHLASLINKANSKPSSVMRTPLQRLGANALHRATSSSPAAKKPVQTTLSAQKFALSNPTTDRAVRRMGDSDGAFGANSPKLGKEFSFDKFLYAP